MNIVLDFIRKRTREEWNAYALKRWSDLRIWIQEHGELAAIAALVLGIILVLAFKIIIVLLVICAVVAYGGWFLALPESAAKAPTPNPPNT